jgi:glycosyltransferase involved in cell wall biosynthesis
MGEGMRISVALCVYNGERYLPEQLDSIASQTRQPDELIVRDDVSTDRSVEIVKSFAARCSFPVHLSVNRENLGSTRNFSEAISSCRGEVIALSDQDDAWEPAKIERLLARFESDPGLDLLFSDAEMVDEALKPTGARLWDVVGFDRRERAALEAGGAFDVLLKHNVATGAAMAFRSRLLPAILPVSPAWVHDGWIALIAAAVGRIGCIPEPLIRYRRHSSQQVGAGGNPFMKRLRIALSMDSACFLRMAHAYREARARIVEVSGGKGRAEMMAGLDKKIGHLEFRASLPAGRLARLWPVAVETARGGYRRYTEQGGLVGPLQDLLRSR